MFQVENSWKSVLKFDFSKQVIPLKLQTFNLAQLFPPIMSQASYEKDEIRWSYHLQIWHADKLIMGYMS